VVLPGGFKDLHSLCAGARAKLPTFAVAWQLQSDFQAPAPRLCRHVFDRLAGTMAPLPAQETPMPATFPRFTQVVPLHRLAARLLGVAALTAATCLHAAVPNSVVAPVAPKMFSGLGSSHTYTPSAGEPLGRIVAKTLPNSPLSEDLLAQAFVSLNPQSFTGGTNIRTLSPAALKVPNHNQLVQLVLAKNEAARPAVLAAVAAQEAQAKSALLPNLRPAEKRENWVRYAGGPVKTPINFDGSAPERKGWVHYVGAAVQRAMGATGLSPDALRWVHYPRVTVVADAPSPTTVAAAVLPEGTADTRNWVRYTAGRSYPVQQFAQLFD